MVDAINIDRVPEADVMVYTIIGHFLETDVRLFEKEYVRTSTLDSDGGRVVVGYFDSEGLDVSVWYDVDCDEDIGVSAGRKIEA